MSKQTKKKIPKDVNELASLLVEKTIKASSPLSPHPKPTKPSPKESKTSPKKPD